MEEDYSSSSSSTKINVTAQTSYDHSHSTFRASKRARHENSKFKGVVPQQNGNWGAQIYANHQRIWLGTFKSEKEAAMAYDSAAIMLRNGDIHSHRNFPWTEFNVQESNFQNQQSIETILNMIRDGSYSQKLADFIRACQNKDQNIISTTSLHQRRVLHFHGGNGEFSCIQLFQKELTPSDVGKLNRLVIPKKFAIKYFPGVNDNVGSGEYDDGDDDVELVFVDKLMKSWKFRYSYWKSSQSFVFTRGWNRFVKDKSLKEKDIVTFYTCNVCPNRSRVQDGQHYFFLIDITYRRSNGDSCVVDGANHIDKDNTKDELELNLGHGLIIKDDQNQKITSKEKDFVKERGLRLFGVTIN